MGLTVMLGACATTPASMPQAGPSMPDSRRVVAEPSGFISFCMRFPDQCTATPAAKPVLALDGNSWQLLNKVNRSVNDQIWPEEDQLHYGRAEFWTIPTDGRGDCDDYAVTKRKELLTAGLPASAVRIAVVNSPEYGRHAVLTVVTDKGDLVLDNLTNSIVNWRDTDFTWIERQDASNPMKWVSLAPAYAIPQSGFATASVNTQASAPVVSSVMGGGNGVQQPTLEQTAAASPSTGALSPYN